MFKWRPTMPQPNASELTVAHPKLQALHRFWEEKRSGRPAPSRAELAIEELRPWLGHLMLLDCIAGDDFRYRVYGTDLVSLFGFDLTGMTTLEAITLVGEKPLLEYRQVRSGVAPLGVSRQSPSARKYLTVDKLALPLMENGEVNKILAAIYPTIGA
jgi:hypothetical protein